MHIKKPGTAADFKMYKKSETGGTVRYGVSDGGFGERGRRGLKFTDEPTGNLDSKNSQDVMDLLTQASRHYQQTILMITHNNNLTVSVDRVLRVTDGVLTDLGGNANERLS